jgi:predicted ribosome quality control (RQC) complex YloA/Tae2 family protein
VFTNWLTYRAVARSLDAELAGATFAECYSQERNELTFAIDGSDDGHFLQFSAEPHASSLILRANLARARKNSVTLFPSLHGATIARIRMHAADRIIRVAMTDGRALIFFFHTTRANVWLIPAGDAAAGIEPLDAFKRKHTFPAMQDDWDDALPDALHVHAAETPADLALSAALRRIRPWLNGTLAEELLYRAGLRRDAVVRSVDADSSALLERSFGSIIEDLRVPTPIVYHRDSVPTHLSIVPLTHVQDADARRFDDIHEALLWYVRKRASSGSLERTKDRVAARTALALRRIDRSLGHLAAPDVLEARAAEFEKYGNLLMIHAYDHPEQPWRMTVPDIFVDPRLVVSIPIDERMTIVENAQRYFDKARTTRGALALVDQRKALLLQQKQKLCTLSADVARAASLDELKPVLAAHQTLMTSLGLTAKGEKDEHPFPFRRFVVPGGFEVWVGRNSANNDELTVRHAHPSDLWFHARGVGGSHVVLKTKSAAGVPGKDAIRAAAAIAAYYSKYRNASNVPVAYTEKKYVIKPRGVPAGTVTMQREKVIMVRPALPDNQAAPDGDDGAYE